MYYYLIGTTKRETESKPLWVGLGGVIKNYGVSNMEKKIPLGISVIYFNDQSKNIYAELPPDREQAKRLSKRIYKDAMTALASERASRERLAHCD